MFNDLNFPTIRTSGKVAPGTGLLMLRTAQHPEIDRIYILASSFLNRSSAPMDSTRSVLRSVANSALLPKPEKAILDAYL